MGISTNLKAIGVRTANRTKFTRITRHQAGSTWGRGERTNEFSNWVQEQRGAENGFKNQDRQKMGSGAKRSRKLVQKSR